MSYERTSLTGDICHMGGHIWKEMVQEGRALLDDMFCMRTCLKGGLWRRRNCGMEGHVLRKNVS